VLGQWKQQLLQAWGVAETELSRPQQNYLSFVEDLAKNASQNLETYPSGVLLLAGHKQAHILADTLWLTQPGLGRRVHLGWLLAEIWADQLQLITPLGTAPTEAALKTSWQQVLDYARINNLLPDYLLTQDSFWMNAIFGVYAQTARLAQARASYPALSPEVQKLNQRIQQTQQAAILFLLQQSGNNPLPETADFVLRNLRISIQNLPNNPIWGG
jgi:hypothetical protein